MGWVRSHRQAACLSDAYFTTIWYSFPMNLSAASSAFERHSSLRSSFTHDRITGNWRWKTDLRSQLPVYDATCEQLVFSDRTMPIFYESSQGLVWINHTVWDAYSSVVGENRSRHFSIIVVWPLRASAVDNPLPKRTKSPIGDPKSILGGSQIAPS